MPCFHSLTTKKFSVMLSILLSCFSCKTFAGLCAYTSRAISLRQLFIYFILFTHWFLLAWGHILCISCVFLYFELYHFPQGQHGDLVVSLPEGSWFVSKLNKKSHKKQNPTKSLVLQKFFRQFCAIKTKRELKL